MIGYDSSKPMIFQAKNKIKEKKFKNSFKFIHGKIQNLRSKKTYQFVYELYITIYKTIDRQR